MQYIPEYEVNTKKCKHDDSVANYSRGIADFIQEEEPLVHQPTQTKKLNQNISGNFPDNSVPTQREEWVYLQERMSVNNGFTSVWCRPVAYG